MDPATWMALASFLGPHLLGRGGGSNQPTTQTNDPNIQRMLGLQNQRLQTSQPLYEAVMQMAMGLLPTQYQRSGAQGVVDNIQLPDTYRNPLHPGGVPTGVGGGGGGAPVMMDPELGGRHQLQDFPW